MLILQSMPSLSHRARPRLRGWLHLVAFFIAIAASVALYWMAPAAHAVESAVYGATLLCLFGVSALYHRVSWKRPTRRVMRRLDHATIYVFIAGTATALAGPLAQDTRNWLLAFMWTGATLGVLRVVFWPRAPRWIRVGSYIALGWVMVFFSPAIVHALGTQASVWIAVGGLAYTAGAVAYSLRWPDPWPAVFGYHEVFHACVVGAAALHFGVIAAVLA